CAPGKSGGASLKRECFWGAGRGHATPSHHLPVRSCRRLGTKPPPSYSRHKARDRTVGPGEVRWGMGMRRLPVISLDPVKFAAGLRAEFADAACTPVPEYLAALMRQLDGDRNEHSGEGRGYGKNPTKTSSGDGWRGES